MPKPAARVADPTAHGGVIIPPGAPTVLIGGMPAARIGVDQHVCPMFDGPKPHVGGPIIGPPITNVIIMGAPAARMGDLCTCASAPAIIVMGCPTVMIGP